MKICCFCDLHLPACRDAIQYEALDWALDEIRRAGADCVVFAGDATAAGDPDAYRYFLDRLKSLPLPAFHIPGNSDLRNPESAGEIQTLTSPLTHTVKGRTIYTVNDSTAAVSDAVFDELNAADADSLVFMHHPPACQSPESQSKWQTFRETHPHTPLIYGHLHAFSVDGPSVCLPALDPDKAIGECPAIAFYDDTTKTWTRAHFDCPIPPDFAENLGVSCLHIENHLTFAAAHHLPFLELRPNIANFDPATLTDLVTRWRENGGRRLSVHLPEVGYRDGKVCPDPIYTRVVELANALGADRFTQHVPLAPVSTIRDDPRALPAIAAWIADQLNPLPACTLGVENMHMTPGEPADDRRRFGYTPEECLTFMHTLQTVCRHPVGINFDIGHARNNSPFSQTYPIGTWLALVGPYAVGYHIHQVAVTPAGFENHTAITDVYGKLISYASFFRLWSENRIRKAPLILEMRPPDAYRKTLETFGLIPPAD